MVPPIHEVGKSSSPVQADTELGGVRKWKVIVAFTILAILVGGIFLIDPWHWRSNNRDQRTSDEWKEAQKALVRRDLPLAQKHLLSCLESCPFNAEARFLLARTCRRAQDITTWQQHLFAADQLQWSPQDIQLEFQLYEAQTGNVWGVERPLLDALKKETTDRPVIYEALGAGYLNNSCYQKVMQLTDAWSARFPEDWVPALYRGQANTLEGLNDPAIAEYRRALKLDPEQRLPQLLLADALAETGQFDEALQLYEKYLINNPDNPRVLYGIASCQLARGKNLAARQALQNLMARNPDHPNGLILQAKIDLATDNPKEALSWLKKAERLAPRNPEISHALVTVFRQLNQPEEAEKYKRQEDEIIRLHSEATDTRRKVRENPNSVAARYEMGRLNVLLGEREEASHWLITVLKIDPNHQEAQKALEEIRTQGNQLHPLEVAVPPGGKK